MSGKRELVSIFDMEPVVGTSSPVPDLKGGFPNPFKMIKDAFSPKPVYEPKIHNEDYYKGLYLKTKAEYIELKTKYAAMKH